MRPRLSWLAALLPSSRTDGAAPETATPEPAPPDRPQRADDGAPPTPARRTGPSWSPGLVDAAVYGRGRRLGDPATLDALLALLRDRKADLAWLGLYRPQERDVAALGEAFGLHALALEDAVHAHQRPKLERYGDTLFVVLRAARYLDDVEEVEFGELHLFLGRDFAVTVRHAESPDVAGVRRRLEAQPDLLARGAMAVLYAVLDAIVDGYMPVVAGLENDIDEIQAQVFAGEREVSRRIYELSREVVEFEQTVAPLRDMLDVLLAGVDGFDLDVELTRHLRDVEDHVERVATRIEHFRVLLRDILTVNATLVAQRQNEEMRKLTEASFEQNEEVKKISAWAAILFAPTLVGTVYGMNFDRMPELHWTFGYPFALLLMLGVSVTLYVVFKRRGWI